MTDNGFAFSAFRFESSRLMSSASETPRLKVLHAFKVYLPDIEGGIPTVIRQLCAGLRERCHSLVLATRRGGTPVRITIEGTKVQRSLSLGDVMSMPIAPIYPFWFWLLACKADLVAFHAPFPLIDAIIWLWFPRRPALVVHWHSEIVGQKKVLPLVRPFILNTLRRADRVVVSSQKMIDASDFLRPIAAKCCVVPFGVDLSVWTGRSADERARIAELREQHPRLVVSVGRLVPYKGYDVLIEAMAQVDGICMIIGGGPLQAKLAAQIEGLGLQNRVILAGRLPFAELKALLHASGLLVMSSVTAAETFGISQIEAMACGCAVVNTDLPTGVPWVARDGLEGLTVPPSDPEALARAISTLLDDPLQRARFGAAALARAEDMFTEARFMQASGDIYEDVVTSKSGGH